PIFAGAADDGFNFTGPDDTAPGRQRSFRPIVPLVGAAKVEVAPLAFPKMSSESFDNIKKLIGKRADALAAKAGSGCGAALRGAPGPVVGVDGGRRLRRRLAAGQDRRRPEEQGAAVRTASPARRTPGVSGEGCAAGRATMTRGPADAPRSLTRPLSRPPSC